MVFASDGLPHEDVAITPEPFDGLRCDLNHKNLSRTRKLYNQKLMQFRDLFEATIPEEPVDSYKDYLQPSNFKLHRLYRRESMKSTWRTTFKMQYGGLRPEVVNTKQRDKMCEKFTS